MTTSNEATPAEQRMESKIDLALRQLDDITQGVAALIAERDAALAKVKQCPKCDRPSIAAFYEYPSMDTVCPLCYHEEQVKLIGEHRDAAVAKVEELEGESDWEHSVYYKIATDFDWMLQARDIAQQQVTDLREALEKIQKHVDPPYDHETGIINHICWEALAATKPEAETEGA